MSKSTLQLNKITPQFLRSAFDGLSDEVSENTGLLCPETTLAQQQFAAECDINTIVNQFLKTGEMPDDVAKPRFGDFTGAVSNYHDALNLVIAADDAFSNLPALLRARFNNDAAEYVEFFNDPKNYDEAIKLGLVETHQESSADSKSNKLAEDDSSAAVAAQKSSSKKGVKADGEGA
ncbi:MAG: internal scaffolding protein [Microvirus sp.]|nr:MAG: internal scaffolding protein [Microvirus sp.]